MYCALCAAISFSVHLCKASLLASINAWHPIKRRWSNTAWIVALKQIPEKNVLAVISSQSAFKKTASDNNLYGDNHFNVFQMKKLLHKNFKMRLLQFPLNAFLLLATFVLSDKRLLLQSSKIFIHHKSKNFFISFFSHKLYQPYSWYFFMERLSTFLSLSFIFQSTNYFFCMT